MTRILIVGNSATGKTTLARKLQQELNLAHLDLDTLAWLPDPPPRRKPLLESHRQILDFTGQHRDWVAEGCYADLLALLSADADLLLFLKLPEQECLANARNRPFEPHKYSSEAAQNRNLDMLIQWIRDYPGRTDACSLTAHEQLFNGFPGNKQMITSRSEAADWLP